MSWPAIQYAVTRCRNIKAQDKMVLVTMAYHTKNETPAELFCSHKRLAEMCGMSRSAVRASLKRLQKAGELELVRVGGIGGDNEHFATDWHLPGVKEWLRVGSKSDTSGVESRPQWGQKLTPEWGRKLTPIEDKERVSIEDRETTNTDSLTSFATEKRGRRPSTEQATNIGAISEPDINPAPARRLPTGIAARNASGEVKAALEARINQLAAMHCDDDDAWFAMLRAEPQFSDISVDAVAKKMSEKTGGIVRDRLVRWLFTEDRTKLPKTSRSPVRLSDAERRMIDCERRRERMLKDEQEMKKAFAAAATADIIVFEPQRAAAGG